MRAEAGRCSFAQIATVLAAAGRRRPAQTPGGACAAPANLQGLRQRFGDAANGNQPADGCLVLAPTDRKRSVGAHPLHAAHLLAAADGLLRLRCHRAGSGGAKFLDQELPHLVAGRTGGVGRVVHATVDHQDGIRRAGRQRAAARLAAPRLRVHRRQPRCLVVHFAGWCRRRLDHGAVCQRDLCRLLR